MGLGNFRVIESQNGAKPLSLRLRWRWNGPMRLLGSGNCEIPRTRLAIPGGTTYQGARKSFQTSGKLEGKMTWREEAFAFGQKSAIHPPVPMTGRPAFWTHRKK